MKCTFVFSALTNTKKYMACLYFFCAVTSIHLPKLGIQCKNVPEISQRSRERMGDVHKHLFSTCCVPSSRAGTKGEGHREKGRRDDSLLSHEHASTQKSTYLIEKLVSTGKCPIEARAT